MVIIIHILTILFPIASFLIIKKKRYKIVPLISLIIFIFILSKKIKASSIIVVIFGLMFFITGITTLSAIFPIFWSIIK